MRRIVAISDFCTNVPPEPGTWWGDDSPPLRLDKAVKVQGSYLERLPLAAVASGLVDTAEVWSFTGSDTDPTGLSLSPLGIWERRFRADPHMAPYGSAQMCAHIAQYGAPEILCVWGLGVNTQILDLCSSSIRIYNSLDVDALRISPEISAHFDIFLTGSPAQTAEVHARHRDAIIAQMPIGPEFAAPETFYPLSTPKDFDIVYVAAAQAYKRHDILFDALAALPRSITALCVIGYGDQSDALRSRVNELRINVTFVGPPGVSHDDVNRLMNRARIGVVCGVNDGAPAILTEYMLAGLPVLANEDLKCGLNYILPETGRSAPAAHFDVAIMAMLDDLTHFEPRKTVLENWAWSHSAARLAELVNQTRARRADLT